ncbi:aminoacyl--tRNA ligase-related protein [Actinocorallia sp. B10E7]|uniref:aminoacyl--tRNA ligase-related protein n=1 Tax=Actinocorallia sp. B10E7 TaxID=3153558 RepID=UPI00325D7D17
MIGLRWRRNGQASLHGPLLELADDCDAAFVALARRLGAAEERHPASLPADVLQRVDYLRSFPHQAVLATGLDPDDENLGRFTGSEVLEADGSVRLTDTVAVREILTPAACYHLYAAHADEELTGPLVLTTRNTCFRAEKEYVPLRRQWSFTMREVVCVGDREYVEHFHREAAQAAAALLEAAGLAVEWKAATDPFFRPESNVKHLMQLLDPTKLEAVYTARDGSELAIGSLNLHYRYFGESFGIRYAGEPAFSCCLAFGVERWLYALTDRHGEDPARWPDLAGVAV